MATGEGRDMKLNRAVFVQPSLRFKVGGMSKLWRHECSNTHRNIIDLDACAPVFPVSCNAHEAVGVINPASPNVLGVFALRNIAQVCNSVIAWVSIYMVNTKFRPVPINVKPCNAMLFDFLAFDSNIPVAVAPDVSCNIAHIDSIGRSDFARENAGQWIIMKKFAQAFCGKIGVSHDAVLSLIGQRPARVDSTCWPCHFTAIDSHGVIA